MLYEEYTQFCQDPIMNEDEEAQEEINRNNYLSIFRMYKPSAKSISQHFKTNPEKYLSLTSESEFYAVATFEERDDIFSNYQNIKLLRNAPLWLKKIFLRINDSSFLYMDELPEDIFWQYFKLHPIDSICENPSNSVKMRIIKISPIAAINMLENLTSEMEFEIVRKDPFLIRYIQNPSSELILLAEKIDREQIETYLKWV